MNAVTTAERRYTPEDLLRMPDGNRYELVDGELVERVMSMWSSYVAGRCFAKVNEHCEKHRSGWVFPEGTSCQCFPDAPTKVRRPDTSFIRLDRLTAAQVNEEGHCPIAPDLAVQVISPNDVKYEVDRWVREFLNAKTPLVWVINPDVKTVEIYRANGPAEILTEKDMLSGENVIPGFSCKVSDLFIAPQQR